MYLNIICDNCTKTNKLYTSYIKYDGNILKSFRCTYCQAPQVIKMKIINEELVEFVERLKPDRIYIEKLPDIGFTIKPKASKRSKKSY